MAKPGGMLGQIGESFEQIGQDIARETVQAPKDIVGKALETLGSASGKKNPKQQQGQQPAGTESPAGETAAVHGEPSEEVKRAIARAALEEISGKRPAQKEESVWERMKKEEEQKKLMEKQRKEAERKASLPQVATKRKRGDLYGKQAKKTQVETGGNKRRD